MGGVFRLHIPEEEFCRRTNEGHRSGFDFDHFLEESVFGPGTEMDRITSELTDILMEGVFEDDCWDFPGEMLKHIRRNSDKFEIVNEGNENHLRIREDYLLHKETGAYLCLSGHDTTDSWDEKLFYPKRLEYAKSNEGVGRKFLHNYGNPVGEIESEPLDNLLEGVSNLNLGLGYTPDLSARAFAMDWNENIVSKEDRKRLVFIDAPPR